MTHVCWSDLTIKDERRTLAARRETISLDSDNPSLIRHLTHSFSIQFDSDLNLMDIEAEQLTIPDAQYSCSVRMPSREFQRIIRDLQVFGDTCTIKISKEGIKFGVTGAIGTGNILLRANAAPEKEEDRVIIDMEEPAELNFALRYLNFFTKASPLSGVVTLSMNADMPIVVEYGIGDNGHVRFFLAPKLDEDDEMEGGDE